MQLDIERELKKQKERKCLNCHFNTKSKEEMNYHIVKKNAQLSRQFFLLANKNFQVTTLSNNI